MTEPARLEIAPRAREQIAVIGLWWRANHEAASGLFSDELATALEELMLRPQSGNAYTKHRGVPIRRVLLSKTRYHVYFSYRADQHFVEVRAVWHFARGKGPILD